MVKQKVLPPAEETIKMWQWRVKRTTAVKLIKASIVLPSLGVAGWLLQNFLQLRGLVNLLASRIDLAFLTLTLVVIGVTLVAGTQRVWIWRFSVLVGAILFAVLVDWIAPKPAQPISLGPAPAPSSRPEPPSAGFLVLQQYGFFRDQKGSHFNVYLMGINAPITARYYYDVYIEDAEPDTLALQAKRHEKYLADAKAKAKALDDAGIAWTHIGPHERVYQTWNFSPKQMQAIAHRKVTMYMFAWGHWKGATDDLDSCHWLQTPTTVTNMLANKLVWHNC